MNNKMVNNVLKKTKSLSWEKWLERPFRAFGLSLSEEALSKKAFRKINIRNVELRNVLFQNGFWFLCEESMTEMDVLAEKYLRSHSMLDITKSLNKFKKDSEKKIKLLIKKKIKVTQKFKTVFEILTTCFTYIWLTHGIESYYDRKLKIEVPKYVKGDINTFIGDASFPKKKNAHALLEEMMRGQATNRMIAKKFGWINVRDFFSNPFSELDIEKMRKELAPIKKHKAINIPKPLVRLFREVQELVFFRTERTDVLFQLSFLARPILVEVAKYYNINFSELKYYRAKSLVLGKPEKYSDSCSFAYSDGESVFLNEPIINNTILQTEIISGRIAFRGIVKGVVKIVKNVSELNKVLVGDVLVTPMTFPNFIPAMNRAAAFVTDEGGITCHAAIVAREMQKPCIIGTKNATSILKDGDEIEVDANKGVVKILNKKA
jgi:phosphohistidine swiveling domain-containing protein